MSARSQVNAVTTEAEFQAQVVDLAKLHGWQVFHALPVQRASDGKHRTAFQGDAGFPDLVMARDGRIVVAELKREGQKPRPEQLDWLSALAGVVWRQEHRAVVVGLDPGAPPTVYVALWRPSDWESIEAVLA